MTVDLETCVSPHNTLQEQQIGKPYGVWRVLVVCQLLNRTHGRQVRPMIDRFFLRWPSPTALIQAVPSELREALQPLGFADQRFRNLKTMSVQYRAKIECDRQFWRFQENGSWCLELAGCGRYAKASLDVVVYGQIAEPVDDNWMEKYRLWRLERQDLRNRGLL